MRCLVDDPGQLHWPYNSSHEEEPLDQRRSRASRARCRPNFKGRSLAGPPEPTTFRRLASRWTGALMERTLQSGGLRHQLARSDQPAGQRAVIYQGDELGLHQAENPRERMQDPFGIRGFAVWVRGCVAHHAWND